MRHSTAERLPDVRHPLHDDDAECDGRDCDVCRRRHRLARRGRVSAGNDHRRAIAQAPPRRRARRAARERVVAGALRPSAARRGTSWRARRSPQRGAPRPRTMREAASSGRATIRRRGRSRQGRSRRIRRGMSQGAGKHLHGESLATLAAKASRGRPYGEGLTYVHRRERINANECHLSCSRICQRSCSPELHARVSDVRLRFRAPAYSPDAWLRRAVTYAIGDRLAPRRRGHRRLAARVSGSAPRSCRRGRVHPAILAAAVLAIGWLTAVRGGTRFDRLAGPDTRVQS